MGPRSPAYGSSPDSGSGRAPGARNWLHGIQELTGYANSHIFSAVFVLFPLKRDWSKTAAEEGRAGIASSPAQVRTGKATLIERGFPTDTCAKSTPVQRIEIEMRGTREGDSNYSSRHDLTWDGAVDFSDFLEFAEAFKKSV